MAQYTKWLVCSKCNKSAWTKEGICIKCDIPEDKVKEMFSLLREYYGEPVKPLSRFCNAIDSWIHAIRTACQEKKAASEGKPWNHQGSEYYEYLSHIRIDIAKSALLSRLMFMDEKLRTKKCPEHKGELAMHEWIGFPDAPQCDHLCGGTGWLPEPEDAANWKRFCNKPYLVSRGTNGDRNEYCRKDPGHEDKCNAWSEY